MFAAAKVKAEPPDEVSLPAQTVTLTGQDRTDKDLQECNADKCTEALRQLQEEALAEGVTVPDGWSCSRHLRLTGTLKGKAYTHYHDPQGTILRSKESVRKRLGLPRKLRPTVQSCRTSTPSAEDKPAQQMLKQTRQGKVVKAGKSSYLPVDLTDADLPSHLKQVPITCGEQKSGVTKPGLWYPCLKVVECQGQCCADKAVQERTMRCSGQHSFEAHCGKNPQQSRWRQSFKVREEGYEGVPVETYMEVHGIKLRKKSSPWQQPSAPLASTQSLHTRTSPEPATAEPALQGTPCQQSSPEAGQEGGCEEDSKQQQEQQQHRVMAASPAAEVNAERQSLYGHMQAAEPSISAAATMTPVVDEAVDTDDDMMHEPTAGARSRPEHQEEGSGDDLAQSEAEGDSNGPGAQRNEAAGGSTHEVHQAAIASLKIKQAKLNRDHKNKVRNLRRQLKQKEDDLQALQQQLAQQRAGAQPVPNQQGPSSREPAVAASDREALAEAAAQGPAHQGGEQCSEERDACVANLEKELASAKAECQQHEEVQQRASAEYARLLEEHGALKQDVYRLRVLGCGRN